MTLGTAAPPATTLVTLGKFEFRIGSRTVPALPTHKSRALVTFLVSNRGNDVARERLLELFWGGFEPDRAREGLRTALSTIRRALRDADCEPSDVFISDKSVVRWIGATQLDSERFASLSQGSDPNDLVAALQVYGGDFLEGNYEEWAVAERERLSSLYESLLAGAVKGSSDTEKARALLARNPYDEPAYATLIESELKANRPAAAAELLDRYRAAMAEINIEPSAEFEARFESIAELTGAGDEQLRVPFVARTAELQALAYGSRERVGTDGYFALVVGDAGIGKSALLAKAAENARKDMRRTLIVRCTQDDPRRTGVWQGLYERLTHRRIEEIAAADAANVVAREIAGCLQEPTVLFIDDVHVLRGDALATFAHVLHLARAAGHGIVASLRLEGEATVSGTLCARADDRIELGPLQRSDIETALALTVDAGASSLAATLYERSGGHPLFFVALLQSLVQKQALRRERGRWRLVRALDEHLELPHNLRASIDVRLHAAGDDAAVIACALALEPTATAEDLAFSLEYPEPRVLDAIDDLLGYALIHETTASTFEFSHDIVREVAAGILNPGRRVALHRAFARRFESSSAPEAKLQAARHYRAAGMALPAARAFLESAQSALMHYAFADAFERANDGAHALERIERNLDAESELCRLQAVRAHAAAHTGETALALDAADEAIRHARISGMNSEIANALLVRSALHGALADSAVQLSDALEASALAGELADAKLRAQAAVQAAFAARTGGAPEQALQLAGEACAASRQCGDAGALYAAYEELLRTQISCWKFEDARRIFMEAAPVAERAGISAQARLFSLQCAAAYLLEQPHHAAAAIAAAVQAIGILSERGDTVPPDLRAPVPLVSFTVHYLQGTLAAAAGARSLQFDAVALCKTFSTVTHLARYANAITLMEIDARLGRNADDDTRAAFDLLRSLQPPVPQSMYGWSDSVELARARLAARMHDPDAHATLRCALDSIEEQAHRMPLDCDRAFARLALAATEAGEREIGERASSRSAYYRALRMSPAADASVI